MHPYPLFGVQEKRSAEHGVESFIRSSLIFIEYKAINIYVFIISIIFHSLYLIYSPRLSITI